MNWGGRGVSNPLLLAHNEPCSHYTTATIRREAVTLLANAIYPCVGTLSQAGALKHPATLFNNEQDLTLPNQTVPLPAWTCLTTPYYKSGGHDEICTRSIWLDKPAPMLLWLHALVPPQGVKPCPSPYLEAHRL